MSWLFYTDCTKTYKRQKWLLLYVACAYSFFMKFVLIYQIQFCDLSQHSKPVIFQRIYR